MTYKDSGKANNLISMGMKRENSSPKHGSTHVNSVDATHDVKHLEIWMASIPFRAGSHVQCGDRPVIIISNDDINEISSVVSVVPLTTKIKQLWMRSHVPLSGHGLKYPSMVLVEQVTTIDKAQLRFRIGQISKARDAVEIRKALLDHLGLIA